MKNSSRSEILTIWAAFAASAALLTVIQPPVNWSPLAWLSLVPLILTCSPETKTKPLAVAAYLVSLAYWLGNLYWVFPITIVGWAAFCLYTALLWPILALALRYCRTRKIPLFLAVPVLFVGAERLQGFLLGGFFWRFLAHSQFRNITLIQIADIFGAAGVSFLVALVNGLLAELILAARQRKLLTLGNFLKTAFVAVALAVAIFYGRWRIRQSDKFIEAGPLIGSLQSNVPQSVKRTFEDSRGIFDPLLRDSSLAARAGAQLIVWPETMVQAILNTDIWAVLDPQGDKNLFGQDKAFDQDLREHAKNTAFLLVGAYGGRLRRQADGTPYLARYNSAFLYAPDGQPTGQQYDKIHLVPFGEVVPFRRRLPALYNFLMKFTPYNYDYSLDYGSRYTVFEMAVDPRSGPIARQARTHKFGVMICYEDTIPAISRTFAIDGEGRKRVDWLVNISNDGWFVRFKDPAVHASTELPQHAAICVFRAVENRLAVVRSVNTGISCIIDSLGRIRDGFVAGTLPEKALSRTGIAGWFVDEMPIDKRVTFFSRYGQWLDFSCAVCLVLIIIIWCLPGLGRTKKHAVRLSGKSNDRATRKR